MRLVVLLTTVLTAACASPPQPLSHTVSSPEALAREVLSALRRGDESRLLSLALNEEEFRAHVWPQLPASRRERNLSVSYVWGDLRQKSDASLKRLISKYRGRHFDVERVEFEGAPADYRRYEVHRGTTIVAHDGIESVQLRACGSMLVQDGRWKVFSYVIDE